MKRLLNKFRDKVVHWWMWPVRKEIEKVQSQQQKTTNEIKRIEDQYGERMKEVRRQIKKVNDHLDEYRDEFHKHIDFTYRDLMILLKPENEIWNKKAMLITEYPVAEESLDSIVPKGTIYDDTRYPRFVKRCEELFEDVGEPLKFLDLGCSGGGMVLEALMRGHYALGLEGSDISLKSLRAEWRLIPEHLKTCDIGKPFQIMDGSDLDKKMEFDVVTAWEVLEHIPEKSVELLIDNIYNALRPGGMFVASISSKPDIDPITGTNWHVTTKPFSWWKENFESKGFEIHNDLFTLYDLARGRYNQNVCYRKPRDPSKSDPEKEFHIVAIK